MEVQAERQWGGVGGGGVVGVSEVIRKSAIVQLRIWR